MSEMITLKGISASSGIGIGKAFVYNPQADISIRLERTVQEEKERYSAAVKAFAEETYADAENIRASAGDAGANILRTHASLASDPEAVKTAGLYMENGLSAEESAKKLWGEWRSALLASDDAHMRERAADADDVLRGILAELQGKKEDAIPPGCVLVCPEFTPYLASKSRLAAAVIAEKGGVTSHGAILARSMGIACVMGVKTEIIKDGTTVVCNGDGGEVIVSPDSGTVKRFEKACEERRRLDSSIKAYSGVLAVTSDGRKISVECNAGNPEDVRESVKNGCDGVGLFRTEFLFCEREEAPCEEEQFSVYRQAAQILAGRPLIIRTLDAGGDKRIPYLSFPPEDNPFLGVRGIRFCQKEKELFKTQLRAILRASAFGNISIMIPMVTYPQEMETARELIAACREELKSEGIAVAEKIPVGAMVETPAAAICADSLAKVSDFFSVGTNDLTQYIMAADRGNSAVSKYYNPTAKPVIRALEMAAGAAISAKIPCHVCGEAAADEDFIRLILKTQINGVSVAPSSVALVKYRIINS